MKKNLIKQKKEDFCHIQMQYKLKSKHSSKTKKFE
jgi:hypothetical protein